ncbi:MFS transporter [Shewanella loihica]|uniref:Major facilitator superfamily MFS_1 n=1 Tax=Shewanella loihica (strain ATCC BAA-1088 / PV-4) TaxID=323850 RepID=A3QJL8_SHELP|nr:MULTISPECIES: MFS transporter [Shewanella]ABO25666.1 hypothetical protein Shew_3800 [Shewanella loihica PV-4]QYJ93789.1 hypothetical protein K0I31_19835 [Shewanella spartinae]
MSTSRGGFSLYAGVKMSVASSVFLLLPIYFDVISRQFAEPVLALTYVVTIELVGFSLASICCFFWQRMNFISERGVFLALALAHLGSALCSAVEWFVVLRFAAGFFAGILIVRCFDTLSHDKLPDAAFGRAIAMQMLYSGLLFLLYPQLRLQGGFDGLLVLVAGFCLLMVLLPVDTRAQQMPKIKGVKTGKVFLYTALFAILMIMLANVGAWSMLSVVATRIGISEIDQGVILATGTLFSLLGAVSASLLAKYGNRQRVITFGVLGQSIAIVLLFSTRDPLVYFVAVSCFMFMWNFLLPFFMGVISEADPEGHAIRLAVAAQSIGAALAPAVLLKEWVLFELVIFLLITLLLIMPAIYNNSRLKQQ